MIPKLGRMSGFLAANLPITFGLLMAPPTMVNTIFIQWVNQSYMAGLNYANKNDSCSFTTLDMVRGYSIAVTSALFVAMSLRKLTSGITKSATGPRLLLLNSLVASCAAGSASYCNTTSMRQAEVKNGINVYSSPNLSPDSHVGVSKICAKQAVRETALSRVALSILCVCIPTGMLLGLNRVSFIKRAVAASKPLKITQELLCITIALKAGLPLAISIFEPVSSCDGSKLEKELGNPERVYFDKGL